MTFDRPRDVSHGLHRGQRLARQMTCNRQGPLKIGLGAVIGVAPAGGQFENQHGPTAVAPWATSKLLDRPVDRGLDVRIGVAGKRQPDTNQAAVPQVSRVRRSRGHRVRDFGWVRGRIVRAVGVRGGRLLFLLCGNLTYRRRRGPGNPQHHSNKDGQAKRWVAGTCAEIANHKLLQSFNPPKFARWASVKLRCSASQVIHSFARHGKL